MATYVPNQLYQVPLAELQPDPAQPRKFMDPAALTNVVVEIAVSPFHSFSGTERKGEVL